MSETIGRKYRKKTLIDVVDVHNVKIEGEDVVHVKVQNEGHPEDQWLIDIDTFERTYEQVRPDFGWALEQIRAGHKVRRTGWNGKGMWLKYIAPSQMTLHNAWLGPEVRGFYGWIGMKTADSKFVPWLASQTDMLAEDWELAE